MRPSGSRGGLRLGILFLASAAAVPAVLAQDSHPGGAAAATGVNYRIMPTDVLDITVFQEDDLKSQLRVSNQGSITFPLIGPVSVEGLSVQEAARAIQERLGGGFLINPQVTVTVAEFSKRNFTVLGQVQKPGTYDMPDQENLTLLQALGIAGGYTRIANPSKVTVIRRSGAIRQVLHLNAKRMASGGDDQNFPVLPGDVITVAESLF